MIFKQNSLLLKNAAFADNRLLCNAKFRYARPYNRGKEQEILITEPIEQQHI